MPLVPRSWSAALEQLQRDARMVARRAAGRGSSPFTTRAPGDRARVHADAASTERAATLLAPRTVRVARVIRETADAVTLVLEDPAGAPLRFTPGQFFTLLVPAGEELLRRAYSASSDAGDEGRVAVTVKRVAGGAVSNHLNDHVREGDLLQVLGPSGSFGAPPAEGAASHRVLIAGGSGITPIMAIVRTALAAAAGTRLTLIYGNRGVGDIIFREALDALAREHADRFTVRHVLSAPPPAWTGGVGLLDERVVGSELDACANLQDAEFLLCGPEPMMRAARVALQARGVPEGLIMEERFNMPRLRAPATPAAGPGPQLLTVLAAMGGSAAPRDLYVAPDQTILEAGLSAGNAMRYSCAMGGCGSCKVRLTEGQVDMEEPSCLSAEERAAGYVLACVSRLRTAATVATPGHPAFAVSAAAQ